MEVSESELVRQAQQGNADAFGRLMEQHQQFVFNLALRTTGDPHEAEDIAQESFVRAWHALPDFRGQSQFRTWLYRIVTNQCLNRLPRLRRDLRALGEAEMAFEPDESPLGADPAESVEAAERRAFLHRQIDRLPESYRMLVTLRFQQELPYEEIASLLNLPLGTVRTGLFRARQKLREALLEFDADPRLKDGSGHDP